MTKEEARIIFRSWQDYMEIANKLTIIFGFGPLPPSLLPYPPDTLEEALIITAKVLFDSGDKEMSDNIEGSMGYYLSRYYSNGNIITDEEGIEWMKKALDLMESNPEWKKATVKSLKEAQDSWIESRRQTNDS